MKKISFLTLCFLKICLYGTNNTIDIENLESITLTENKNYNISTTENQQEKLDELTSTFLKIENSNKWIQSLDNIMAKEGLEMPIGIKKKFGENTLAEIAFSNMSIDENYTIYTVYAKITLPSEDQDNNKRILFFGGDNLKFDNETNNFEKGSVLYLLKDIKIPLSEDIILIFKGGEMNTSNGTIEEGATYATLNCNGLDIINLKGLVSISNNIVTPLDDNLTPIHNKNLDIEFSTNIKKWEDIIIDINDKKLNFEINNLKEYKFLVQNIVLDFSSIKTNKNIKLPDLYTKMNLYQGDEFNSWEGIYIKNIVVQMPKYFHKENSGIKVSEFIFDRHGVSGDFSGINILNLGDVKGENCNYSLDTINVIIGCNDIEKFDIRGKIKVPALENPSNYVISIEDDRYLVSASISQKQKMPLFLADIHLDPTSTIDIIIEEEKFKPGLCLNGFMSISEQTGANIPNIVFRELRIKPSEEEKISVKEFGIKESARLFNLPIIIKEISLNTTKKNTPKLYFDMEIEITENVSAGGSISVIGQIPENKGLEEWKYKDFEINKLNVDASISGGIKIKGFLESKKEDAIYGNFFKGAVKADFNGISVDVEAVFGATKKLNENYSYFYLDGMVNFGRNGVPIAAVLQLNGFGGGAWKNMTKKAGGESPSGQRFEPCKNVSLGVRASVSFSTIGSTELLNGKAGFEMEFSNNGGIRKMGFFGEAKMLDFSGFPAIDELKNNLETIEKNISKSSLHVNTMTLDDKSKKIFPSKVKGAGMLSSFFMLEYNFDNKTLDGNIETYLDVAGLLVGTGPDKRAGYTHLHFSERQWYIHLGTPTNPNGINMKIGKISLFELKMYFMTGTNIPELPPIPKNVFDIVGRNNLMKIDESKLLDGKGIIFGTNLNINPEKLRFLCFYANFNLGLGFDILLKEYKNVSCKGSTSEIGINGWYAKGQAYAYVEGEVGIYVNIWGFRGEYEIFNLGVGALLQAELPNPIWMKGVVGGRYRILSGLVKGSCSFKFELGEKCEMVGNTVLDGMPVIQEIKPDSEENVDIFSSVQVLFNFPIEKEFEFKDEQGTRTYKISLSELKVISEKEGEVLGKYTFNEEKDLLTFIPDDGFLPPNQNVKISTIVRFKKKVKGNWIDEINTETNSLLQEKKDASFVTGDAPDKIFYNKLSYIYPTISQNNFYKKETNKGYFVTSYDIDKLILAKFKEKGDNIKVRLLSEDDSFKKDLSYNLIEGNKGIEYILPTEELDNNKKYKLVMVSIPNIDNKSNISTETKTVNQGDTENTMEITTKKLEGNISNGEEHILLDEYTFKTSMYNTFEDKIKSITKTGNIYDKVTFESYILGASVSSEESFENLELEGNIYTQLKPLIDVEAVMDDNYFNNLISFLYRDYPIRNNISITNRNVNNYGIIPKKAIYFNLEYLNFESDHLKRNYFPYKYALHKYYLMDYVEIRAKATNYFFNSDAMKIKYSYLLNSMFPFMNKEYYKMKLSYTLPGGRKGTTGYFNFENKL